MKPNVQEDAAKGRSRKLKPKEIIELVDKAIRSYDDALSSANAKVSASDLVRLVQLRKELGGDEPASVTVRWVDECKETLNK